MYLHLGCDTVVNTKNIISILDLESTSVSKYSKEFLKIVEEEGFVRNVSEEIPKTYIVCEKKKEKKVYISQLSSQTLYKRAERNEEFGTENQ